MDITKAKRIVFKFGTNILRNDDKEISLSRIYSFIEEISKLHKQGKEVIIITSGAVGLGSKKLDVNSSDSLSIKQACAAVGQCQLMSIYEDGFNKYSINFCVSLAIPNTPILLPHPQLYQNLWFWSIYP